MPEQAPVENDRDAECSGVLGDGSEKGWVADPGSGWEEVDACRLAWARPKSYEVCRRRYARVRRFVNALALEALRRALDRAREERKTGSGTLHTIDLGERHQHHGSVSGDREGPSPSCDLHYLILLQCPFPVERCRDRTKIPPVVICEKTQRLMSRFVSDLL